MDLLRRRLYHQHLAGTPLSEPEEVVRLLGAVQSQDYSGAKWSLGQRLAGATDGSIDRAFDQGRILRTHVLRPTWQFVTPEDIRWLLRLTAPRVLAQNAYQYPRLELDRTLFRRVHVLFERALRGGRQLTRAELGAVLRRAGIAAAGQRLAYIVMEAELAGLVCSGALRGKRHTYALLGERAQAGRTLEREEALAELTIRFFTGHGPATLRHYAWWAGLTLADARAGVALAGDRLTAVEQDGHTGWMSSGSSSPGRSALPAYLLPEYDEAVLGYKEPPLPDLPRARARWRDDWLRPVLIGGKRAGTWRRTVVAGRVRLETSLFAALDRTQRGALEAAAGRYGRFLGLPVRLA